MWSVLHIVYAYIILGGCEKLQLGYLLLILFCTDFSNQTFLLALGYYA